MSYNRSNNVAGAFARRCNRDVAGEAGRRKRRRDDDVAGIERIALRGPGCISGTGRCGDFTASFVENNGVFAEGYGNVDCDLVGGTRRDCFCGQVSPAGNVQRRHRRESICDCLNNWLCYDLTTPTTVPR